MLKEPYVEKLKSQGGFDIFLVNGKWIRDKKDIEFNQADQHLHKKYIPKNEIWLDSAVKPKDRKFLIDQAIHEARVMEHHKSYTQAEIDAVAAETKARKSDPERKHPAHEKLLGKVGKMEVWLVDGEAVRDDYFEEFNQGGNPAVYKWIPKNEIWLDDGMQPAERKPCLLHELHEYNLMKLRGWKYEKAHHSASMIELRARHNMQKWDSLMAPEIAKAGGKGKITWLTGSAEQ